MVGPLGQQRRLVEVAELAVGHPEPRPVGPLAGQRDGAGHQPDVVGLAVELGGHRHGQPRARQVGHQHLAADDRAGPAPGGLEPLGDPLDLLAVEADDLELVQRRGQGLGAGRGGQQQRGEPRGGLPEEGLAESRRDAAQLGVVGLLAGRHLAPLGGALEGGQGAALVQDQRVAGQGDDGGESQQVLVAAAPMAGVEVVEELGVEQVGPGGQGGVGQRDSRQDHGGEDVRRESEVRGQELADEGQLGREDVNGRLGGLGRRLGQRQRDPSRPAWPGRGADAGLGPTAVRVDSLRRSRRAGGITMVCPPCRSPAASYIKQSRAK